MRTSHNSATIRRSRAGTVYIAVLGVSLTVAVMAITAMSVARLERRADTTQWQQQQARMLAHAATEHAINTLQDGSAWRGDATSGAESSTIKFGRGEISWKYVDIDGNFGDDLRDVVEVQGIGRAGDALAVESVTLQPSGAPLSCLEVAMIVDDAIVVPRGNPGLLGLLATDSVIKSDQTVASNADVDATNSYAKIEADVEAVGSVSGTIDGSENPDAPERVLPNADVFAYYKANGTWIPVGSLPVKDGAREINNAELSADYNPYGTPNPQGIYVVDCQGQNVWIGDTQVIGTLVLLNAGTNTTISSEARLQPAVINYPVLLVDGNCRLAMSGAVIEGLVYINGTINVTSNTTVAGCLIGRSFLMSSAVRLEVNYRPVYHQNPPPGFAIGDPMRVIPGTWKRAPYAY